MKVYVASSWRNAQQPLVVAMLRALGHEVYDFRNPAPGDTGFSWKQLNPHEPPPGQPRAWGAAYWRAMLAHPIARAAYKADFGALEWCDAVVMVLPAGRSASWELGFAMGQGKPASVLALEPTEPELMFAAAEIVGSLDELEEWLEHVAAHLRAGGAL